PAPPAAGSLAAPCWMAPGPSPGAVEERFPGGGRAVRRAGMDGTHDVRLFGRPRGGTRVFRRRPIGRESDRPAAGRFHHLGEPVQSIINAINGIIWSDALIALCLGAGLWFSFRTRFMQV